MSTVHGTMRTPRADRYAKQLFSHWSARGPVTTEGDSLVQRWEGGQVIELSPREDELGIRVSVGSTERSDAVEFAEVVARHLERFGTREELSVTWEPERQPEPGAAPEQG